MRKNMQMNRKGEVGIGSLITIAIIAIVGSILLQTSAQNVGDATNTIVASNLTYSGTNGTTTSIVGKVWTNLVIYNATNDYIISAGNYTLSNNVVIDGQETSRIAMHIDSAATGNINNAWLISGTYQPDGYIASSGSRSIAGLIIVLFALAIAVVMLYPTLRSKVLGT